MPDFGIYFEAVHAEDGRRGGAAGDNTIHTSACSLQSGELPVLPLSIPGAISMAHVPDSDSFLSGDEWFVFKFGEWSSPFGAAAGDLERGIWSRGSGAEDPEQWFRSRRSGAMDPERGIRDGMQQYIIILGSAGAVHMFCGPDPVPHAACAQIRSRPDFPGLHLTRGRLESLRECICIGGGSGRTDIGCRGW